MKHERRKPCPNCPFRKEAALAHWHPSEYLMLARLQRTEGNFEMSGTFGCHKDESEPLPDREPCVGWLIHQRENGVPSIALRLKLSMKPEALAQFEECVEDGDQYESIAELVRLNIERDQELNPQRYEDEA